jgi:hypothetical protein
VTIDVPELRPEPPRDRYGRYLIASPDGTDKKLSYTRATTVAETIDSRYNLEQWAVRTTAQGIIARPDIYAAMAAAHPDDRKRWKELCEQAKEAAKGSQGATLGSALHSFTEQVDRGYAATIPAPWDADVGAYKEALGRAGVQILRDHIENVIVLDDWQIAGMFDRLVRVDGELVVADLKTGRDLTWSWGAIAVQLGIYAHADHLYDPTTATRTPFPAVNQERALVMHLPVGQARCDLYWVDIAAGWEAAQHCRWVRAWRNRRNLATPLRTADCSTTAADPPERTADRSTAAALTPALPQATALRNRVEAIRQAGAISTLIRHWPADVPTFKQAHTHTPAQLDLIRVAVERTETDHELTFQPGSGTIPPRFSLSEARTAVLDTLELYDDDVARAILAAVLGRTITGDIGAIVDLLDRDEAARVVKLCDDLGHPDTGVVLAFDPDQRPTLVGDLSAYTAA